MCPTVRLLVVPSGRVLGFSVTLWLQKRLVLPPLPSSSFGGGLIITSPCICYGVPSLGRVSRGISSNPRRRLLPFWKQMKAQVFSILSCALPIPKPRVPGIKSETLLPCSSLAMCFPHLQDGPSFPPWCLHRSGTSPLPRQCPSLPPQAARSQS